MAETLGNDRPADAPAPKPPQSSGPQSSGPQSLGRPARRGTSWLIAVLLLAAAGAGWWYYMHRPAAPSPMAQSAAGGPPPVTVSTPLQREIVEWDEFTGQFAAVEYVELRARVSGYLEQINFQDGQIVKKGDLLFVIDPRPFEIALASAQATLAQASARLELANRQLARAGTLRERDFVAASVYDERTQDLRAASGAVEGARAAVRAAELDLEFTRVTAPVGGRVSQHAVSVGNLVSGGAGGVTTLLTSIVSVDPIRLTFDMSESDFLAYQRAVADGKLKSTRDKGVEVEARLMDETRWSLKGTLDFVDNQVDRTAGTIRVRAIFPNPGLLATPGQFGRLRLPASDLYQAILIPDSAVVTDQSRKIVMTVQEDGTVEPRIIRPGPTFEGLRIVRSGLKPDDRVIINGLVRARPGAKVTPQPGKIEAEKQPG
jgi:RND family efflux transporter MFP subunit